MLGFGQEPLGSFSLTGCKLATELGKTQTTEDCMPSVLPGTYRLEQKRVCERFGAAFVDAPLDLKVGISLTARQGDLPFNGLRHPPEKDTTGWFIWGGKEFSDDPEFFHPLCVEHLPDWCPMVIRYLGLPPGWRFLIADNYEDVWFDEALQFSHDD